MHSFDLSAVVGATHGAIDSVDYVDALPGLVQHPQPTAVPRGAPVLVSGWAVDPNTNTGANAVCVLLSGTRPHLARTRIARGDIAVLERTDEFVGYQAVIPTDDIGPGPQELRTYALAGDGYWYESASAGIRVYQSVCPSGKELRVPIRLHLDYPVDMTSGETLVHGESIAAGRWALFSGWAIDRVGRCGAGGIALFDDLGRFWSGPSNIERPDVSRFFQTRNDRLGFDIAVPAAVLGRGHHTLSLVAFDATGARYANTTEVKLDVVAPTRAFPLTARVTGETARYKAQLRVFDPVLGVDDDSSEHLLPSAEPIAVDGTMSVVVEGWALRPDGSAADELYIEVSPTWISVPASRHAARAGRRRRQAPGPLLPAPVDNGWFDCKLERLPTTPGDYAVSLIVVDPRRTSISRAPLATLRVIGAGGGRRH